MFFRFVAPLLFLLASVSALAQDRFEATEKQLRVLADSLVPGLNEKADIYISKTALPVFLSGLGKSYKLNISADPSLDIPISVSFSQESVLNILIFLMRKYDLEYQFTGSIITVAKYKAPPAPALEKELSITYNKEKLELSLDLKNDTLVKVLKRITQLSGKNVFVTPELQNKLVSLYIQNFPLEGSLEKLAGSNDLELTKNEDGTYLLSALNKLEGEPSKNKGKRTNANSGVKTGESDFIFSIEEDVNRTKTISVDAKNKSVDLLIQTIADHLGINYVLLDELKGNTTVKLTRVTFENFLNLLLAGTNYTSKKVNDVFIIGERGKEGLRATEVVQLQYRAIDEVLGVIPGELKKGVETKEFKELNSIVFSGSSPNIQEIKRMIDQIDKPVPVIMIEVIIMDVTRQFNVSTGITAGVGDAPVKSGGTVLPGIDLTLGGTAINNFLNLIGLSNLGGVGPNFYLNLKALETNGYVNVQSTPRLSTLNGHEATINIGNKDYYVEQTQNIVGTQNPQTVVTNTYKPVNADFSITINPVVSGDEQITLDVTVNQSDFTARTVPGAPPGQTERKFKSMIRVKNNDMIVLGGLEKNQKGDTGKGLPLLSRVPGLKWLFSSREKTKQKNKLIIFIKPTIIY